MTAGAAITTPDLARRFPMTDRPRRGGEIDAVDVAVVLLTEDAPFTLKLRFELITVSNSWCVVGAVMTPTTHT